MSQGRDVSQSMDGQHHSGEPVIEAARPYFDRIGDACDALVAAGWVELAAAIAGHGRERRGALKRMRFVTAADARHITDLCDELDRLVALLEHTLPEGGGDV